jgi:hypothetical protein
MKRRIALKCHKSKSVDKLSEQIKAIAFFLCNRYDYKYNGIKIGTVETDVLDNKLTVLFMFEDKNAL